MRESVGNGRGSRRGRVRKRVGDGRGSRRVRERVGDGGWWDRERFIFT